MLRLLSGGDSRRYHPSVGSVYVDCEIEKFGSAKLDGFNGGIAIRVDDALVSYANKIRGHARVEGFRTLQDLKDIIENHLKLTEDDFAGVSNLVKSAGCNIFATRDKYAEDEYERNTTLVEVPKCRWTGKTGYAGEWFYEIETHTMYDKDDYFMKR